MTAKAPLVRQGGPPDGPICGDDDAHPHWATRDSKPPRCERHYELYLKHLAKNRRRTARGQPHLDYDPGPATQAERGFLLLAHEDLGKLLNLTNRMLADHALMGAAKTEVAYRMAGDKLRDRVLRLHQHVETDLGGSDLYDRGSPPA